MRSRPALLSSPRPPAALFARAFWPVLEINISQLECGPNCQSSETNKTTGLERSNPPPPSQSFVTSKRYLWNRHSPFPCSYNYIKESFLFENSDTIDVQTLISSNYARPRSECMAGSVWRQARTPAGQKSEFLSVSLVCTYNVCDRDLSVCISKCMTHLTQRHSYVYCM